MAVKPEDSNTLYHALQCFTGAITHKPTVHDDKRELKGSTLGFDTMDNRLKKVSDIFGQIAGEALRNSIINIGEQGQLSRLNLNDKDTVKSFLTDNESAYGEWINGPLYTEEHEIMVL